MREYNIGEDSLILLYVGRLLESKRVEDLIKAAIILKEK